MVVKGLASMPGYKYMTMMSWENTMQYSKRNLETCLRSVIYHFLALVCLSSSSINNNLSGKGDNILDISDVFFYREICNMQVHELST